MRRKLLSLALAAGLGVESLGCQHPDAGRREPANVPTSADVLAVAAQPYQDAVVEEAFLLGAPDARGRRVPTCWINPSGRPDLVPKYLRASARGRDLDFGLPKCTEAQTGEIRVIAGRESGPQTAFVPALIGAAAATLGTVCAIDFALTAAMMVAINTYANRERKSIDRQNDGGNAAGLGVSLIGSGNAVWGLTAGAAVSGPFTLAAVVTTCTLAGGAAGYWLVPLRK